ncbi:anthranilate phosphoribosyltransferase [Bacillus solitudinis]|uniref:anthranilate phosphoribosyltransferase n=1 Tax=Bacillus solitudinis TaxID=2014074 RepID=UPI000C24600E|nr:glycosyl transferase [Bacillus solitudinis]
MQQWLKEVARGKKGSRDLTYEEAFEAASQIASGEASIAQCAAFFVAERMKEESSDELRAFVDVFYKNTEHVTHSPEGLLDCAGPYVGRNTFAATIPVSLLLSEKGIPVLLHGSDPLPPKYGSSLKAILKHVGIESQVSIHTVEETLLRTKIGFADTESFCKPLAKLRDLRKEIGVRTLLNTVEKLGRVAQGETLMLGAFHKTAITHIIPVVKRLYKQVFIVQGVEGSEDIPIHRNSSFIYKLTDQGEEMLTVRPSDYGFNHQKDPEKELITFEQQAELISLVIEGNDNVELSYYRDQVIFNAGIRYFLLNKVDTIEKGIQTADDQLRNGQAKEQWLKWQQVQGKVEG